MARAVTLDAGLKKALEARSAQPVACEIGLVIARRTATRDLVLHLAATPPTEEGLAPARVRSAPSGGRGGAGKGRVGGGASLDIAVDSEWVLEQTAQATRRLPGGLSVAGVYCSAPRLGQAGGPGAPAALHALAVSVGAEVYAALKSAYDPFAGSAVGWESGTESEAGAARRVGARGGVPRPPRRPRRRFGNAPPSLLPTSPPVYSPLVLLVDSTSGRVAARAAEGAGSRGGGAALPVREVAVADLSKQLMAFETTLDVSVTVQGVDVVNKERAGDDEGGDSSSDSDRAGASYDADTDDGRAPERGAPKGRAPPSARSSAASSLLAPSPEGMAAATARTLDGAIVLLGGQVLEPGVPIESAVGSAIERVLADADAEVEAQRRRERRAQEEEEEEEEEEEADAGAGGGAAASGRGRRRREKMGFSAPPARSGAPSSPSPARRLSPAEALEALYGPEPHPTVSVDLATPAPPGRARSAAAPSAPSTVVAAGRASLRAVVGAKEDAAALLEALRNDAAVSALARGEALLETLAERARAPGRPAASRAFAMPARVAFPWPTLSLPLVADVLSEGERPEDAWERVADVFGFDEQGEGEGEQEGAKADPDAEGKSAARRGAKSALALETEAQAQASIAAERARRAAAPAAGGALAHLSPAEAAKFGAILLAVLVVVVAALVSKLS